ncbi:hypothetical protein Kfla_1794 [Kribbella flavida DSM 17836]|uniref:Lipoprotein n=2 Tax=Kribbella flavida TaxID=182640 RepID=D2PNN6_KRIFD|nr:hypothetical protein Kfla_1794 [Kribbella flavida DSM 17836]
MRARRLLPAALALVALLGVAGCANGGGLRVEGSGPSGSSSPAPASQTPRVLDNKDQRTPPAVTVSLAQVRQKLLADPGLEAYFRTILAKCDVAERCMTRGATVNVLDSDRPQLVVYIHTIDKFIYGAVLIALETTGPRPVWSLRAEQLKIKASQQGDLVVESGVFAADDATCCPSVTRVDVYRWNGRQMIKVSSQDQKGD